MMTLLDYAHIAAAVYENEQVMQTYLTNNNNGRWAVRFWQAGTKANGFQGTILEDDDEVVCAFKGTSLGSDAGWQDLWNDMQLAINYIPTQAHSAAEMVQVAKEYVAQHKPLSIVGHSLGGGLAQLVGWLLGVNFVTFNAPGMANNASYLRRNAVWQGQVNEALAGSAGGYNMILGTDPIGNYGSHVGRTERWRNRSNSWVAHMMTAVLGTLQAQPAYNRQTLARLLA